MRVRLDSPTSSLEGLWADVERAIVALTLDQADPSEVLATLHTVVRRHLGVSWPLEGEGDLPAVGLAPEPLARLSRAFGAARAARDRKADPEMRELRHDLSSSLTGVLATLELLALYVEEQKPPAHGEVPTGIAFAREAAARAVTVLQRWPR